MAFLFVLVGGLVSLGCGEYHYVALGGFLLYLDSYARAADIIPLSRLAPLKQASRNTVTLFAGALFNVA